MEKITEIKNQMQRGDFVDVARTTGYTLDNVMKVFRGRHHNEKIVEAAQQLLIDRERRNEKFKAA